MNKKIVFLIIALFTTVFLVIFLLSVFIRNNQPSPPNRNIPPIDSPTPTQEGDKLIITSIFPVVNTDNAILPFQKITVSFNTPVSPENIFIETNPKTETNIFQGVNPTEVFITPSSTWTLGKTELTILQTTSSIDGKRLRAPVIYSIVTSLPTLSPEELEGIYP
jgi:hypothetical protein